MSSQGVSFHHRVAATMGLIELDETSHNVVIGRYRGHNNASITKEARSNECQQMIVLQKPVFVLDCQSL
jgi:hypothetical protein